MSDIHSSVQAFYADKTDPNINSKTVCSLKNAIPKAVCRARSNVHPKLLEESFGCGLPFPGGVGSCRVLDLGSGPGLDVFTLSQLVGEDGAVTGVDMTPRMIQRAEEMIPWHIEKFGFSNVDFRLGTLEELDKVEGLESASFDVIISNCVICLTADKRRVFEQAFRLLRPGGELCFSDIFAGGEKLPEDVRHDSVVWNEGFGGALTWEEFECVMAEIGYHAPLKMATSDYQATDDRLKDIIGERKFFAVTLRAFKPAPGKASKATKATYKGTLGDYPDAFPLSICLSFPKGEAKALDENVACVISQSRFAQHFDLA